MINKLIKWFLDNRLVTLLLFAIVMLGGVWILQRTPVDAIPDLSENQVIVMTQWPGQSPQNIEDQVTYPLTVAMQGLAGVKDVRAMSQMGVSMVTVIFQDDIDLYFARDRVVERLSTVRKVLPEGVMPELGPDATGLGQIFMYTLESDNHSLTQLRSMQDFQVAYALGSVDGVAEVASIGGYVRTYQVVLDPIKLDQYGVRIQDVITSIKMGNNNVSGKVVDTGEREIAIQGIGFFEKVEDIASMVIKIKDDGTALTVQDIGDVRESGAFRRGILASQHAEKVGGVVVMRYGENPLQVIEAVKKEIEKVQKALPEGVKIVPFYDRTRLIVSAIDTMKSVLIQELIITGIILAIFLASFGATIITAIALVIGVVISFILMYFGGIPSNIMSLGGIAIAVGTMVDSAIVVIENIYRKLLENKGETFEERLKLVKEATLEVGKPIVFAIFIIILSFVPIFTLQGMEGKLFSPLAYTNMFAMIGALITALFLVPILALYFMKGKLKQDEEIKVVRRLKSWYEPILKKALLYRKATLGIMVGLVAIGGVLMTQIGSEFMPPLDEGAIMYMPMTVPNVSERKATELLLQTNEIIAQFPEVETVVGKAGRANTATDPAPLAMLETFVTLKPKSEWRDGMTKSTLVAEINRAIQIDKLWNGFTQPIIGRVDMLSTGIRAQVGIKIFGNDPNTLEQLAIETENLMNQVPGASGVAAIRTTGLKYLNVDLDEGKLSEFGIPKMDALTLISAGVGGNIASYTIEGRERYGIELRLKQDFRSDVDDVKSLMLTGRSGNRVPLSSVADIRLENGPATINSENGVIRSAVQMNVVGTDLGSFVESGQEFLQENLELPDGYSVEWSGQYENQIRAKKRLSIIVPIVIFIIFLVLYFTYKDFGLVSIVMLSIPLSMVGGIVALFIAQYNLSVAVWVGFISLFGNAVETGVVIVVYLENAYRKQFGMKLIDDENEGASSDRPALPVTKEGIHDAVLKGATLRLRPVLMTAFTSVIGLFPMLYATGVGAEVQKPLAIVVVGGLTTSVVLTLVVIPVLFSMLREWQMKNQKY
ncbi:efflux RND transporter permease subunit [Candidatus Nomurabacteria bacterium]|nr:efflux RND transporter permease subunit [Candidatus Nomurabacteria bacterium]